MDLCFDRVHVCLSTNDDTLTQVLGNYFRDWFRSQKENGKSAGFHQKQAQLNLKTINFSLNLVRHLDPRPASNLLFGGTSVNRHRAESHVTVTQTNDYFWLLFNDGAIIRIPIVVGPRSVEIWGQVTPNLINSGRLEDVFYTAIAPILRRWGYVMLHAFGAVSPRGKAVLLVGPTNSGKTTSGLCLLLSNWKFLSNDVVLIRKEGEKIHAFPLPSGIGLTSHTLKLLPELADRYEWPKNKRQGQKLPYPLHLVTEGWSDPAEVEIVCFPQIGDANATRLDPCGRAIALARLAEQSVDSWDRAYLEDSVEQLETLSWQADNFDLLMGRDLSQLAELLAAI